MSSSCFSSYGCGVVFKLDPAGKETVLHTFTGGADGGSPSRAWSGTRAGNLYGTTYYGGIPISLCAVHLRSGLQGGSGG